MRSYHHEDEYQYPKYNFGEAFIMSIGVIVIVIGAVWGIMKLVGFALDRNEIAQCHEWQSEVAAHGTYGTGNPGGFYLVRWQKDQCDAHGITIDAPVL